jgi:hypothetical protein
MSEEKNTVAHRCTFFSWEWRHQCCGGTTSTSLIVRCRTFEAYLVVRLREIPEPGGGQEV